MSSSQHIVIDLSEARPDHRKYKRKLTFQEIRQKRECDRAIDSLLGDRLELHKSECKAIIKEESVGTAASTGSMDDTNTGSIKTISEWWDDALLSNPEAITHLIEHPVPLKGTTALAKQAIVAKAMLTPAERDKLRKLKKKEKVQDMQDKIKMGLLKPPPPKIKMKNLMLVLGKEAVAGPSAVEQLVKAQVEQRLRDHEQRNAERKLSPQERRDKNIAKWTRPLEKAQVLKMSAYLIFRKISNKVRFKISKNAEQLHLGGLFLNSKLRKNDSNEYYPSLVVAEGSGKAVKRFDRLLLHRIDWLEKIEEDFKKDENMQDIDVEKDEDDDEEEEEEEDGEINKVGGGGICVRIFNGSESKKKYTRWSYQDFRDYESGMQFLEDRGCMHFWSMVDRFRSQLLDV